MWASKLFLQYFMYINDFADIVTVLFYAIIAVYISVQYKERIKDAFIKSLFFMTVMSIVDLFSFLPNYFGLKIMFGEAEIIQTVFNFLLIVLIYYYVPVDKMAKITTFKLAGASIALFITSLNIIWKFEETVPVRLYVLSVLIVAAAAIVTYEWWSQVIKTNEKEDELARMQKGGKFYYKYYGNSYSVEAKD